MLLHENSSSIDVLLGNNVHYRVPRYQRRYVWDYTNWDTLWKDILFQLKTEEVDPTHFTGPIVTRSIGRMAYEVIDGQQRLATFQIILCVIRDLCKTQDDDKKRRLAGSVAKYIVNHEDVSYEFTFVPTEHDRPTFNQVTSGECVQNRANSDKDSILRAYNHFAGLIREHVGENLDYEKMRLLFRCITDRFSFIHINLGGEDERPEKVFASINATGRKLSEFDYLRNDLFLRAADKAECFYETYWDFEEDPNYWNEDRLDSFFRAFLAAKQGPNCFEKNAKPFEVYQQYRERLTTEQGIEYEFKQLKKYARVDQDINKESSNFSWPRRLRTLCNILDLPSLDPFMLFVTCVSCDEDDINLVCEILESYIVRRLFFCNDEEVSYQTINKFFSAAIKAENFNRQNFTQVLYATWPKNEPKEGFTEAKSKDPGLIKYILSELSYWEGERASHGWDTNQKLLLKDIEEILSSLDDICNDRLLFGAICSRFCEVWKPFAYLSS